MHPSTGTVKVLTSNQSRALEVLRPLAAPGAVHMDGEHIILTGSESVVPEAARRLIADGLDLLALVPSVEQGLEDMFFELTASDGGNGAPDAATGSTSPAGKEEA